MQILKSSRFVVMGVAFVGVMAGAGGLMGAIGGMVLTLLSHTVLGQSAGLAEFMPTSTGVGTVLAGGFAVMLITRQAPSMTLHHSSPVSNGGEQS